MESGENAKLVGVMRHRCPNCRMVISRILLEQSRREKFYPFCSERCKWVDLGHWLDENYRIVTDAKKENGEQRTENL
ncbi:MAG: DNA gyrase inhibitor YacG [Sedimentisphaerales bacterium]|nr:DNA gyrase inhibitor YacG [Sedimentisphaerales bacterium]